LIAVQGKKKKGELATEESKETEEAQSVNSKGGEGGKSTSTLRDKVAGYRGQDGNFFEEGMSQLCGVRKGPKESVRIIKTKVYRFDVQQKGGE